MHLARRAWLIPTVVQSSASSEKLSGLFSHRDVQHIPSYGFGKHLARIHSGYSKTLVHATYTQVDITRRSLSARRRSGSRYFEIYHRPRAARDSRVSARVTQNLFLRRFIDESIGASFWKNIPRRRFYVTGEAGIKF